MMSSWKQIKILWINKKLFHNISELLAVYSNHLITLFKTTPVGLFEKVKQLYFLSLRYLTWLLSFEKKKKLNKKGKDN